MALKAMLTDKSNMDLFPDINYAGIDNWTALHFASYAGHANVLALLL